MPARANRGRPPRGGPRLLWAAALTAMAPSAFAEAPGDDPLAASAEPSPARDDVPAGLAPGPDPWIELIAACAKANTPLAEAEAPPVRHAAYLDASPLALAVRHGAPLVPAMGAAAPAFDPWIPLEVAAAEPQAAPLTPDIAPPAPDAPWIVADADDASDAPEMVETGLSAVAHGDAGFQLIATGDDAPDAGANVSPPPQADAPPPADALAPLVPVDAVIVTAAADAPPAADGADLAPLPDPSAPQRARRRPGQSADAAPPPPPNVDPGAVAPPQLRDLFDCEPSLAGGVQDHLMPCAPPVSDRWRLAENLGLVNPRWWDPYNQNTLKGDRPVPFLGEHWFFVGAAISDTIIEPRSFPIPMGVQTTERAGSLDVFGDANSLVLAQTFILSAAFIEGSTAFKPQDWEYRLTLAGNINFAEVEEKRILYVRPDEGTERTDSFVGVQELFVERHLANVSDRYDFDSVRVGIQPFSSDFRGFLFQDNQLGVRFFGTRNNNRIQYNLAAFARLEKDTNSGLNDVTDDIRKDYVFLANVYRQDTPVPGFTSQLTAVYNMNREADEIEVDTNGFPARPALIGDLRPREYDVGYVGYNADGHVGRFNLTASAYYAFGEDRNNTFTGKESVIRSYFVAAEPSIDFDWIRVRGSAAFASGDDNPYDDVEEGFDAIFENPQFAGADTSFWIRQSIPFIGGGRAVSINGRNGLLPSLRSSKEQGQSNFINPGLALVGAGADFDVLPELRLSTSVNHLSFVHTESMEALRMDGSIDKEIGWDVSAAATYRPGFIQNFVFRLSGAALLPGDGFKDLFDNKDDDDFYYSVLFNATLSY